MPALVVAAVSARRHRELFRWTQRNEDKPHRCPGCHGIAERAWAAAIDNSGAGPRTVYCCGNCLLRWRVGVRVKRHSMAFKQVLVRMDGSSCKCCR